MLKQKDFFKKYGITQSDFDKCGLSWKELEAIYVDFERKLTEFTTTGNSVVERIGRIPSVHATKMRVKDPEHLIEKIIRKNSEDQCRNICLKNYSVEITDLIGVRALHLFKDDSAFIDKEIKETWELVEKPTIYIRNGDACPNFSSEDAEVKEHSFGYRSVHYLIRSQPTKLPVIAEIQVRTIFEEGWSEIDHLMRYPYDTDNLLLANYLSMFNRLAGNADEMGSFIRILKNELSSLHQKQDEQKLLHEKSISELVTIKNSLASETQERQRLEEIISDLKKTKFIPSAGASFLSSAASGVTLQSVLGPLGSIPMSISGNGVEFGSIGIMVPAVDSPRLNSGAHLESGNVLLAGAFKPSPSGPFLSICNKCGESIISGTGRTAHTCSI